MDLTKISSTLTLALGLLLGNAVGAQAPPDAAAPDQPAAKGEVPAPANAAEPAPANAEQPAPADEKMPKEEPQPPANAPATEEPQPPAPGAGAPAPAPAVDPNQPISQAQFREFLRKATDAQGMGPVFDRLKSLVRLDVAGLSYTPDPSPLKNATIRWTVNANRTLTPAELKEARQGLDMVLGMAMLGSGLLTQQNQADFEGTSKRMTFDIRQPGAPAVAAGVPTAPAMAGPGMSAAMVPPGQGTMMPAQANLSAPLGGWSTSASYGCSSCEMACGGTIVMGQGGVVMETPYSTWPTSYPAVASGGVVYGSPVWQTSAPGLTTAYTVPSGTTMPTLLMPTSLTVPVGTDISLVPTPPQEADPKNADLRYGRGYDLYYQGRYVEALAELRMATRLSVDDARYWYYQGMTELAMGDMVAAQSSLLNAARLHRLGHPDPRTIGIAIERIQGPLRLYLLSYLDSPAAITAPVSTAR